MRARASAAFVTLMAFAAFAVLGLAVAHRPPGAFDLAFAAWRGRATAFASPITAAGRFPAYATFCVLWLAGAAIARRGLRRAIVAVVALVVAWQTSDLAKAAFHRARPADPLGPETSFSYPSGHAVLALAFFGCIASAFAASSLPPAWRRLGIAACVLWIAAIGWSRLALGAHYATDVAGGYCFGAGWLVFARVCSRRARTSPAR